MKARDSLWYKDAIFYEAYVRGFQDSTDDGNGDLSGLTERLDYLRDLGVNCLWLMPIFQSPLKDDGYDISDFLKIDEAIGNDVVARPDELDPFVRHAAASTSTSSFVAAASARFSASSGVSAVAIT